MEGFYVIVNLNCFMESNNSNQLKPREGKSKKRQKEEIRIDEDGSIQESYYYEEDSYHVKQPTVQPNIQQTQFFRPQMTEGESHSSNAPAQSQAGRQAHHNNNGNQKGSPHRESYFNFEVATSKQSFDPPMLKQHELLKMSTIDQAPIGVTVSEEMIDLSAESIIVADVEDEKKYNRSKLSNVKKVPPLESLP